MTNSADTHCPYCALQCAMTLKSPAELTPASEPGSVPVPAEAAALVAALEQRKNLRVTKLSWASGVVLVTKL